jgi:lipid-binding SYLF domain-containing protein
MKRWIAVLALVGSSAMVWASDMTPKQEATDRLEKAGTVLQAIANAPDKGIPDEVLNDAKCIAVVPNLVKAGFIFGGKHGRGVATCKDTAGKWSAPSFFTISGGSWGAQIGVEGVDLVMMIMNDQGMQHMMSNKFQVGGEASASAGPVGRHASAGTDWKAGSEMLTYSRSKGLFAGIELGGSWIGRDADPMNVLYGTNSTPSEVLSGKVAAPADAQSFLAEVRKVEQRAQAKEAKKD